MDNNLENFLTYLNTHNIWHSERLSLNGEKRKTLIKEINTVRLCPLTILDLTGNNLESIEILHRIESPFLEWVDLRENSICTLKASSKLYWPRLRHFNFSFNPIAEGRDVLRGFTTNKFRWFAFKNTDNTQRSNDLSFIVRMPCSDLRRICKWIEKQIAIVNEFIRKQLSPEQSRNTKGLILDSDSVTALHQKEQIWYIY